MMIQCERRLFASVRLQSCLCLARGGRKILPKLWIKRKTLLLNIEFMGKTRWTSTSRLFSLFSLLGKTRLKLSFHVFFRALGNRSGLVSHHFKVLKSSELWIVAKRAAQQAADPSPHSSLVVFTNIFHCWFQFSPWFSTPVERFVENSENTS